MASANFAVPTLLIGLLALLTLWARKRSNASSLPLPPGPKPLPIVGNLFDMPTKDFAPSFRRLNEQYGDIVYLDVLGQPTVIIGTYDAAVAILEGRSANTSDRPRFVMAELCGVIWQMPFQGYWPSWRRLRRSFHQYFHQTVVHRYRSIHLQEAKKFLHKLLDAPEKYCSHSQRVIGSCVLDAMYGIQATDEDDPYIINSDKGAEIFSTITVPGRYLVETFPILAYLPTWFPGAGFKRQAAAWKPDTRAIKDLPYNAVIEAMSNGTTRTSVVLELVTGAIDNDGVVSSEEKEHIKDFAGITYNAGADTTFAALMGFFLAMVNNPDIQRKAQKELDAVVGVDRLPSFEDREALPYVNAVVKEVLRWHSVIPTGVPHRAIEDDEYNGYRIPAGSILVANAWAMSRDPVTYPDPDNFIPERFLSNGQLDDAVRDPMKIQFGFGRRICPGRHFSNDVLFINVASVLHTFNILPPLGDDGLPVPVVGKIPFDGTLSHPEPFACRIQPRSAASATCIRKSLHEEII